MKSIDFNQMTNIKGGNCFIRGFLGLGLLGYIMDAGYASGSGGRMLLADCWNNKL